MRKMVGAFCVLVGFAVVPANAGVLDRIPKPIKAMASDVAIQIVANGRVDPGQTFKVGLLFAGAEIAPKVNLPKVPVPGHVLCASGLVVYSICNRQRFAVVLNKFTEPEFCWHAPDQGENKPLGMGATMDWNHVALGFSAGAAYDLLGIRRGRSLTLLSHSVAFEGMCEAEHRDGLGSKRVPWEIGDFVANFYGFFLYNSLRGSER